MKGRNSTTISVRVPDELAEMLNRLGEHEGITASAYVKRLLEDWTGIHPEPLDESGVVEVDRFKVVAW